MDSIEFDVLIIGSGLVGLSLARALADSGLTLGIVGGERAVLVSDKTDDWDARIYAISPSSAAYLAEINAWPTEEMRLTPVARMRIFGDAESSALTFDAYEAHLSRLATIVENRVLASALQNALAVQSEITRFAGSRCVASVFERGAATVTLADGRTLRAKLLVAADGAESWLRAQADIAADVLTYDQTAVVANFLASRPHRDTAYQWFRTDGVLALLPLPGTRVSMVWSTSNEHANRLIALNDNALCAEVAEAARRSLGPLSLITPPARFPLQRVRVQRLIGPRLALVGDAAHNFHPLAGQGVNLGFEDARELASVLKSRGPETDAGSYALLRRYERARREPIFAMTAATHGLQRLFNNANVPLGWVRNTGLSLTDRLAPLKSLLVKEAIGTALSHHR